MARKVNGTGQSVHKTGEGHGGGPVGSAGGYSGRPGTTGSQPNKPQGDRAGMGAGGNGLLLAGLAALLLGKNSKGGGKLLRIIILAAIVIFLLKSCGTIGYYDQSTYTAPVVTAAPATPAPTPVPTPAPTLKPTPAPAEHSGSSYTSGISNNQSFSGSYGGNSVYSSSGSTPYGSSGSSGIDLASLFGGYSSVNGGSYSTSGWTNGSNCGQLNTSVDSRARSRFTTLKGSGRDKVTIMVYMCGTDLESNYGMATNDLTEMANASISDNINLIIYTGGCTGWKNSMMSNKTNQIYKLENGGKFYRLNDDVGNISMTTPTTLSSFIRFCASNYPADRNMLIFWDHGGGSITGYGYDQRFKSSGSMTLDGINKALSQGGVKFDFIGFDACLMATAETAQMASQYADYLIASEESEPGIGWYYTNWLNRLSANTSASTLEIGKQIVDDFVDVCNQQCKGQDTTLSLTDLAEFSVTVPPLLNKWADATTELIKSDYKTVSTARGRSKEFAQSSKIDQADLAHVAFNLGTDDSRRLANALLSAVKYNRTSSTVQNAYGLSVYFPYRSVSSVKTAVNTYSQIGMDSNYSRCIQAYATYAASGQASSYSNYSGGSSAGYSSSSPLGSLLQAYSGSGYSSGGYSSGSSYSSSYDSADLIYGLLSQMMGGRSLPAAAGDASFMSETFSSGALSERSVAQYLAENRFNASALVWTQDETGAYSISLPKDQWDLVNELKLSLFLDDGEGFIDMGLDLTPDYFDAQGRLGGGFDRVWISVNGYNTAFYQLQTVLDAEGRTVSTGRIPCLYNGQRANLIVEITDDEPAIIGVYYDYVNGETGTVAKSITEYNAGDTVEFVADYYTYEGKYVDNFSITPAFTVGTGLTAEYVYLSDAGDAPAPNACYRFTDIYGQDYWTPVMFNA